MRNYGGMSLFGKGVSLSHNAVGSGTVLLLDREKPNGARDSF